MEHLPIPFRIRLGVTGHRELQDEDILKEKVRNVLEKKSITSLMRIRKEEFVHVPIRLLGSAYLPL